MYIVNCKLPINYKLNTQNIPRKFRSSLTKLTLGITSVFTTNCAEKNI